MRQVKEKIQKSKEVQEKKAGLGEKGKERRINKKRVLRKEKGK